MAMKKQRSFSFKPTRFLVFHFVIWSSVIFVILFIIWVIKASPSVPQETNLQFNKSSLVPITVQTLTGFSGNSSVTVVNSSIWIDTHVRQPENASGFGGISVTSGLQRQNNESKVPEDKETEGGDFKGRWVYDESYPLYTNSSCPFIDEGFNCQGNGRSDQNYIKWRWQPQDCEIPRFNATRMLELIRGKRLVFVGDSINRNQWESMLCMLFGAINDPKRVYETHGRRITKKKGNYSFKFVDHKCTVEFYATHFLVLERNARLGRKQKQILRIDAIDRSSSRWKAADILVFNTAHWWSHDKTKAGINYYEEEGQLLPRLDVSTAFRKAMTTWALWVDRHINPSKTQVFFRSSAPSHFSGGKWNSGGHCREATQPLQRTSITNVPEMNIIVEEVIKQMKTPVTILNITSLSGYRIDGHPSIYGKIPLQGKQYSSSIQDCSHWCLPGVPDSWNEILYAHLQSKRC
ncbi:hypothetical protein FNV43_RR23638 [Rhamnella rubrinervis]|uniref:Trichome birefringence-like N-terminal domain-containing protein n=1 Tax=Rhamnella rubrinervis TaxID=2594499 RepID=A0A8K0DXH7_9ROSA|nr:hypothetical protein FNV43_RR23638 [Rhamnella rubrinervis]